MNNAKKLFEIIVMVGAPGTGKSTKVRELTAKYPEKDFVVLSTDDLLMDLGDGMTYDEIRKTILTNRIQKKLESKFKIGLREAINQRRNIIVDRTCMGDKARNKILSQVPREYDKIAYVFQVPRAVLDNRLNTRSINDGKTIRPSLIDEMLERFVMPSKSEFHKIFEVKTDD